jgi:hypothetical protein
MLCESDVESLREYKSKNKRVKSCLEGDQKNKNKNRNRNQSSREINVGIIDPGIN